MSRESADEFAPDGSLLNGYDYKRQAWVRDGRYLSCAHVIPCDCYGKTHEGERVSKLAK